MKTKKTLKKKGVYFNKYTITIILFAIWISCLDTKYSWIKQYRLTKQIVEMENEREDVIKKLKQAKEEYHELTTNTEKYAREKYFLRKKDEEVFIIK